MWAGGPGLAAVSAHEVPGIPAQDSFVIQSRHPVETSRAMPASRWLAALALDWSWLNPVMAARIGYSSGARVDAEAWVYSASVKHSLEERATPDIWESPPGPIKAICRN